MDILNLTAHYILLEERSLPVLLVVVAAVAIAVIPIPTVKFNQSILASSSSNPNLKKRLEGWKKGEKGQEREKKETGHKIKGKDVGSYGIKLSCFFCCCCWIDDEHLFLPSKEKIEAKEKRRIKTKIWKWLLVKIIKKLYVTAVPTKTKLFCRGKKKEEEETGREDFILVITKTAIY